MDLEGAPLEYVRLPNVTMDWKMTIANENIELINDTYCSDIHDEQTKKYVHEWPYVATGDRIRKLLPNLSERLKEKLVFCGNRTDITGTFQKLGCYTSLIVHTVHFQISTKYVL